MEDFKPNYKNILSAAKNIKPERIPLYEHIISVDIMEKILNKKFYGLYDGDLKDKKEFFRLHNIFFKKMGYDTVSYECCIRYIMPGSGALEGRKEGVIKNRKDFESYPWNKIPELFFSRYHNDFTLLIEEMPPGMKAIGGPGNGIFECVQDLVGLNNLCMIAVDDPELYDDLFNQIGKTVYIIWKTFLENYSDVYAVCRFGDDLGFKTSTLLNPDDIKTKIIPQYKRIIDLVHFYKKPFLLHSCGNIFCIMKDLINGAGIDAKHSNEDAIAPFSEWVSRFGDRIGNFGGVDMSFLVISNENDIEEYVNNILRNSGSYKGFAFGTGNSIPDYMPVENYLKMIETAREFRKKNY
ncbi:MAG: uroporphyrinogen decarboxylase family protein [Candidatus Humimicrobiaceae bacterium]